MDQPNVVLRYRDGRTERVTLVDANVEQQVATVRRESSTREICCSAQMSSTKSPLFCARMTEESTAARRTTRPSAERRCGGFKTATTP